MQLKSIYLKRIPGKTNFLTPTTLPNQETWENLTPQSK